MYLNSILPDISLPDRELLDRLFPDETEYNHVINDSKTVFSIHSRINHTFKDPRVFKQLSNLISISNYLSLKKIPDNLVDALTLLLCERSFITGILTNLVNQVVSLTTQD